MNRMKNTLLLCLFLSTTIVTAQYESGVTKPDPSISLFDDIADPSVKYAMTITEQDLLQHLSTLASDEFEGRETGEPGNDMAARYISDQFKSLGVKPLGLEKSFFQPVAFTFTKWQTTELTVNGKKFRHLWDFLAFPDVNENISSAPEDLVFLGYGIDDKNYSDYKGNNVNGKSILIYNGEPQKEDGYNHVSQNKNLSGWDVEKKLELAKSRGVKFVYIIENDIKGFLSSSRDRLLSGNMQLGDMTKIKPKTANHAFISSDVAKEMMGNKIKKVIKSRDRSRKKGKAKDISLSSNIDLVLKKDQNVLSSQNVLGFIEGTEKKDEIIVVSAHYDHLGKRADDIYNGADDNASGTSTVLEIAEAFKLAKESGEGPKRSILCILFTGEEKGLLGSRYYSESPVLPLAGTVANVNVDMIGRVDKKYMEDPNYIYVIGSDRLSSDLHRINEAVNQKYAQITLDYTYNDENDPNRYYNRSDHFNFARKGVPAIFYFSGVHEDYHRTSDTAEKIMFGKMEKVARLIFHTTWELANREDRIRVDGEVKD